MKTLGVIRCLRVFCHHGIASAAWVWGPLHPEPTSAAAVLNPSFRGRAASRPAAADRRSGVAGSGKAAGLRRMLGPFARDAAPRAPNLP